MISTFSKSDIQAQFTTLPEKFRKGKVGQALERIIAGLDSGGRVPLGIMIKELYPGIDEEVARHRLQTQIINRPYETANGSKPLELKMSRKPRSGQSETQEQWLWFECAAQVNYAELAAPNDRYDEAEFVQSQAVQATGAQIRQAQELPLEAMPESQVVAESSVTSSVPDAFTCVEQSLVFSDITKQDLNLGRLLPQHGIESLGTRTQITDERFIDAAAAQTDGMPTETASRASDTVTCIKAMLQWACSPVEISTPKRNRFAPAVESTGSPHAKPLLALLGDYGTGKTSHAQQLTRVLNGLSATTPKPENSPMAVMVDLALLAGAERLNELSLIELLVLGLKKQRADAFRHEEAKELIKRVRHGEVVLIYDGFDELIKTTREKLHGVLQQLLNVLQPVNYDGDPSKAKVMLSCRTHYFRDAHEQLAFFDTRSRGQAKRGDYLCMTLMPWTTDNITTYLSRHLNQADTKQLLGIIEKTYNLHELASRPVLLAMMSEQLGELLRLHKAGEQINATKLYGISVAEWVQRDAGKHVIHASHKPLVMGALASAMSSEGTESWSAEKLDRWIVSVLPKLYPVVYSLHSCVKEIQDDLRTATFIVRPVDDQFNFAHKSFKEYFTARFVWDCLSLIDQGMLDIENSRELLVSTQLNAETMGFLREWWVSQTAINPLQAARNTLVLIGLLQDTRVNFIPFYLDEAGYVVDSRKVVASEKNGYYQAPDLHQTLFEIGLRLDLFEKAQIGKMRQLAGRSIRVYASLRKHINLRGLEFKRDRWRNLDFSELPLDLRDGNLLQLRTYDCEFGNTLCARANWAQTVMRDSSLKDMDWGEGDFSADRGGQIIRYGEMKQPTKPLKGPWTGTWGGSTHTKRGKTNWMGERPKRFLQNSVTRIDTRNGIVRTDWDDGSSECWDLITGRTTQRQSIKTLGATLEHLDRERNKITYRLESYSDSEIRSRFKHHLNITGSKFNKLLGLVNPAFAASLIESRGLREFRCLDSRVSRGHAHFDTNGNLHGFDEEAADSWLFCLASGKPEPVEFGVPVDD